MIIKSWRAFLEAKISSDIKPKQAEVISDKWGKKYLDYESGEVNPLIKLGEWKLSEADRKLVLCKFLKIKSVTKLENQFSNLPDKFINILKLSIDERYSNDFKKLDLRKPSLELIDLFMIGAFKSISSESISDWVVIRKSDGTPIKFNKVGDVYKSENMDLEYPVDDDKYDFTSSGLLKRRRVEGELIFSKNNVTFFKFISIYNSLYDENIDICQESINSIFNITKSLSDLSDYSSDINIFKDDIYLRIDGSPKSWLNISVSKFFSSCQNLFDGMYGEQLLINLFDRNSVPVYLLFKKDLLYGGEVVSDFTPIGRRILRVVEDSNDDRQVLILDNSYPERLSEVILDLVNDLSGNKIENDIDFDDFSYSAELDLDADDIDQLNPPYMDNFGDSLILKQYFGKNLKSLIMSKNRYDWDLIEDLRGKTLYNLVIDYDDPGQYRRIQDINFLNIIIKGIETEDIDMDTECETLRFYNSKIVGLSGIKIKTDTVYVKSCKIENVDEFINFLNKFRVIGLTFTLGSGEKLSDYIGDCEKLEVLEISSDLMKDSDNRSYVESLKNSGISVSIIGPKLWGIK